MTKAYVGYEAFVLDDYTREVLLKRFPPKFDSVVAHHITNLFGVPKQDNRPFGQRFMFTVVGYACNERIEALVVSRDGGTHRPDGGTYHITLSLDKDQGARPVHSNDLIKQGYKRVDPVAFFATFEYI